MKVEAERRCFHSYLMLTASVCLWTFTWNQKTILTARLGLYYHTVTNTLHRERAGKLQYNQMSEQRKQRIEEGGWQVRNDCMEFPTDTGSRFSCDHLKLERPKKQQQKTQKTRRTKYAHSALESQSFTSASNEKENKELHAFYTLWSLSWYPCSYV